MYVVDGQLYIASGQGTPGSAVYSVGTGLPTSGSQTYAPLNQANNLQQYNSFVLADLDVNVPGFDTIYAVDSRATSLGGLEKWTKTANDGLWHFNNKMQVPSGSMFGLTGFQQGSTVTMYVTSTSGGTGASSLYSIVDTAGYNVNMNGSFTDLVPGGIGSSVFKSIAMVPSFATTVTTSGGAAAYTENAAATAIDAGLTLSDADSAQLYSATVSITGNFVSSQDVLSFTPQGGITGTYSAVDGVLRLSGTASVADYQSVLRSVKYQNTSDNPNPLSRTISFSVRDNSDVKSNVATRALNITATNDAPVNSVPGGQVVGTSHTLAFSSLNGNQISFTDVDAQSGNLLLSLSVNAGTISLSTLTGLTGTGNGTGSLSYSGTLAALNTALNGMVYSAPGSPQAVTLTVGINDQGNTGTGGALSDSDNVAITVSAIANSPPVVTLNASPLAYTENAAATAVDSGLTITDSDDANLIAATVSITGNFATGQDVLAFTNQLGITGSYDSLTGVLTLSGNSSVANYQTALRSVTYFNNSDNPTALSRTVTLLVSDGKDPSVAKNRTINITAVNDAPVNTVPGGQSFAKNNAREFSTLRGNALSISDVDVNAGNEQVSLSSANGTITLATLAGLTGSGNGTGSLTYSGAVAAINAALNGMIFNPTLNFTGTTSISLTTNDLGNTGSGGAQATMSSVPITVNEPAPLLINEILLRAPAFNSTNQYVELRSTSGGNYAIPAGTYLVGIEGHEPFNAGEIHDVFNLNGAGMSTGSNGYLAILPSSNLYQIPTDVTDPAGNKYEQGPISPGFGNPLAGYPTTVGHTSDGAFTSIESANPVTFFLIQSSTAPAVGDDIDSNDDGIADGSTFNNWTILDSIGMGNSLDNSADYLYGAINFLDPTGSTAALSGNNINTNFTPAWVGRSGTTTGSAASDWVAAKLQGTGPFWEVSNTKVSQPGYGGLPLDTSATGGHIAGPNFPGVQAFPVVDLNGPLDGRDSLASFIAGGGAVNIFSSTATTTDFDSPNLTQLTITIGNLLDGANETLAAVTTGTSITASYSSGTLTLSGSDTLAHYQQVLRTVTYNNAASTPNRTTRTLTATASDGVNSSLVSKAQVGVFTNTFSARINEIDLDPPGNDNPYEYIELRGTPGSSLSNMYLVAFESVYVFGNPGDPGVGQTGKANFVQALSGTFPASGLVIIKSPSGGFTPPGGTTIFTNADLDTIGGGLKNGSNSFFLINSTTPIVKGTDYDTNDDGTLEALPGSSEVVDSIAWEDRNFETDIAYGTNQVTQFDSSPDAVTRFPSNTKQTAAAWFNGALVQTGQLPTTLAYDPANTSSNFPVGGVITPGAANYPDSSSVAGRFIFYNQSSFDGNSAVQGTSDDLAIATDKTAYIPNNTLAVFGNITSFSRGINGIMVDVGTHGRSHVDRRHGLRVQGRQ